MLYCITQEYQGSLEQLIDLSNALSTSADLPFYFFLQKKNENIRAACHLSMTCGGSNGVRPFHSFFFLGKILFDDCLTMNARGESRGKRGVEGGAFQRNCFPLYVPWFFPQAGLSPGVKRLLMEG